MFKLRKATFEDAHAIARVHIRSWKIGYKNILPESVLSQLDLLEREKRWQENLNEKDHSIFVVLKNGEISGFSSLGLCKDSFENPETTVEITSLYVDPTHWRKGLGSLLCKKLIQESINYKKLVLWVLKKNLQAQKFYEKLGFKQDGHDGFTTGFGAGSKLEEIRYSLCF